MTKIKAIIFDLDGVLADTEKLHFEAFNSALQVIGITETINRPTHEIIYKGMTSRDKFVAFGNRTGLVRSDDAESSFAWQIFKDIKDSTYKKLLLASLKLDSEKLDMLKMLSRDYKLAVCTNNDFHTMSYVLDNIGVSDGFFTVEQCREEGLAAKPAPALYLSCIEKLGLKPSECLIVEDSPTGIKAAQLSGAHVCEIDNYEDVNYYRILADILEIGKINVVVPAAGMGKRFSEAGYTLPKPLIDVDGIPMIGHVLNMFNGLRISPIVLLQKYHIDKYCLNRIFKESSIESQLVPVNGITEGAAATILLSEHLINNDSELIIVNSDQFMRMNIEKFLQDARSSDANGAVVTFPATEDKWSYASYSSKLKNGDEMEVETGYLTSELDMWALQFAEKIVISDQATAGIYWFRRGSDFVRCAKNMMRYDEKRVNGEWYVAPVYNELLDSGDKVLLWPIEESQMYPMGTPKDLAVTLSRMLYEVEPDDFGLSGRPADMPSSDDFTAQRKLDFVIMDDIISQDSHPGDAAFDALYEKDANGGC